MTDDTNPSRSGPTRPGPTVRPLTGRVVVVTGAAGGIGQALDYGQ